MPLLLALAPAILQVLLMGIKWIGEKTLSDDKKELFFEQWKAMCMTLNLAGLVEQYELSIKQEKANDAAWDRIEAEEAARKKGKK